MKLALKRLTVPICIAVIILGCFLWIALQNIHKQRGNIAEIRVSGEIAARLSLAENTRRNLSGADGIDLVIVVENGSVYVEHSDCPDKICEKKGRITNTGDMIVCLPARTVIEIVEE